MKDPTISIEARRLLRMAQGRYRSLNKQINTLNEQIDQDGRFLIFDKQVYDKHAKLTKQRDTWEQVMDWLTNQLSLLDAEQIGITDKDEDINLGESYQLTDEEKREILGKLSPDMTRTFAQAYADFIFRCEEVGIRVSGVSFYPEGKGKPQHD